MSRALGVLGGFFVCLFFSFGRKKLLPGLFMNYEGRKIDADVQTCLDSPDSPFQFFSPLHFYLCFCQFIAWVPTFVFMSLSLFLSFISPLCVLFVIIKMRMLVVFMSLSLSGCTLCWQQCSQAAAYRYRPVSGNPTSQRKGRGLYSVFIFTFNHTETMHCVNKRKSYVPADMFQDELYDYMVSKYNTSAHCVQVYVYKDYHPRKCRQTKSRNSFS